MYGFGQNMSDIPSTQDTTQAVLFECISQTFNVLGMAIAKWSLGLFLLRIVQQTWQKVAIWAALSLLMGASISCLFCFWFQCSPPAYLWDRTIPGGKFDVDQLPISIILGSKSTPSNIPISDLFGGGRGGHAKECAISFLCPC
jgi:hypothetical protein